MGRFITVTVQCDWGQCDTQGIEGEGTVVEKTLSIDNKQARVFLLCKNHLDQFEEVVLPLMAAGIKVEAPVAVGKKKAASPAAAPASGTSTVVRTSDEEYHCQVDDCGRTLKNRTGMAQHVIRSHGFESMADYEERYPSPLATPA